ncbi:class I SAM-dependent methyltransferase [Candidatus Sumerlaeota bacterium]|nr:class I SAM-dependent methyltransferase [Candidatus Sumerlaeota bacterium]
MSLSDPATPHWVGAYFGAGYRHLYPRLIDNTDELWASVDWIATQIPWGPGDRVLDLACGYGRHLEPLLRRPGRPVGIDLLRDQLLQAKRRLGGAPAALIQGDMARLPLRSGSFRAVLMLFNSFGYCKPDAAGSDAFGQQVLAEIARVLTPDGRALLELPNREHIIRAVEEQPQTEIGRGRHRIVERWQIDGPRSTLIGETTFIGDERTETHRFAVRLFSLAEITHLASSAGLRPVGMWGNLTGAPLRGAESEQLVLSLERLP